jgi:hypothetical protein
MDAEASILRSFQAGMERQKAANDRSTTMRVVNGQRVGVVFLWFDHWKEVERMEAISVPLRGGVWGNVVPQIR